MGLYHTVYSPDGATFEVAPDRGADLVLNKGWSNTPPKRTAKSKTKADAKTPLAADTGDNKEDDYASTDSE